MSVRTLLCGLLAPFIVVTGLSAQVRDTVGPVEKQAKPITPENPIPRRSFSVPAIYPAEARGIDGTGSVALVATIDETGRVVEMRKVREPLVLSPTAIQNPTALKIAGEAMVRDAAAALQRWTYDPPANGPMSFLVTFSFKPGADATATQSASVPPTAVAFQSASATAAGAAGSANQPVRVGGNVKAPVLLSKVSPVYPAIAQSARVSGIVILEALIAANGSVTEAKVLRSIPLLDQAALDAVRQWQYEPTLLNGVPTPVIMTVTVTFTLPEIQAAR